MVNSRRFVVNKCTLPIKIKLTTIKNLYIATKLIKLGVFLPNFYQCAPHLSYLFLKKCKHYQISIVST